MADANCFLGVDHGASRSAADVAGPSRSAPLFAKQEDETAFTWRYRLVDLGGDEGVHLAEVHFTDGKPTDYSVEAATFAWFPEYGGDPAEMFHRALSRARNATIEPILIASEVGQ